MNGGQRKPPQRKNADPFALGAVDYYATKHGVDPKLALGVADQETGFMDYSPQALSPAGARGTMQVMKGTGLRHVSPERFETAEGQIEAGILELRRLSDQHKGDVRKITRGYLGGAVDPYSGITAEQYAGHVEGFAGNDDDDPFAAAAAELGKPVNEAQSIINDLMANQQTEDEPIRLSVTQRADTPVLTPESYAPNVLAPQNKMTVQGAKQAREDARELNRAGQRGDVMMSSIPFTGKEGVEDVRRELTADIIRRAGVSQEEAEAYIKESGAAGLLAEGYAPSLQGSHIVDGQYFYNAPASTIANLKGFAEKRRLAAMTPEQKFGLALKIAKERPLTDEEHQAYGTTPNLLMRALTDFTSGTASATGNALEGVELLRDTPVAQAIPGVHWLIPDNAIGDAGKKLTQDAETARNLYGGHGVGDDLLAGAGSTVPFLAAGAGGRLATATVGAMTNAGAVYREALRNGATEEQARRAAGYAAPVGILEIFGIGGAIGRAGVKGLIRSILRESGEEATQEAVNAALNNLIAQRIYDPKRNTMDNVAYSAFLGAVLGGGMGGGMHGLARIGRQKEQRTIAPPESVGDEITSRTLDRQIGNVQFEPEEQELVASLTTLVRGGNLSIDRVRELREQAIAEGDVKAAAQADAVLKEVGTDEQVQAVQSGDESIPDATTPATSTPPPSPTTPIRPPVSTGLDEAVAPSSQGEVTPPKPPSLSALQEYGQSQAAQPLDKREALRRLAQASGDELIMTSTADGTFAGVGELNIDEQGNVVLTRHAGNRQGLTKQGSTMTREELRSLGQGGGSFGGNSVNTSAFPDWASRPWAAAQVAGQNGATGVFRIPLAEMEQLLRDGDAVFSSVAEGEISLLPHIAEKYLAEVQENAPESAADAIVVPELQREDSTPPAPRQLHHERFGTVSVSEDQSGVPAGKIRVVDASGSPHIIQNPRRGNQAASFVRQGVITEGEQGGEVVGETSQTVDPLAVLQEYGKGLQQAPAQNVDAAVFDSLPLTLPDLTTSESGVAEANTPEGITRFYKGVGAGIGDAARERMAEIKGRVLAVIDGKPVKPSDVGDLDQLIADYQGFKGQWDTEEVAKIEAFRNRKFSVPENWQAIAPRQLSHERFGAVSVSEDQSGVPVGKIRVVDSEGNTHIIQNPRTSGNRGAAFVRPTTTPESQGVITEGEVVSESAPRVQGIEGIVSRERQERRRVEGEAAVDKATGLQSKNQWEGAKGRIDADPNREVVLLDVNDLKKFNDNVGHKVGDEYLAHVGRVVMEEAERMGISPRQTYRIGGDEIVIDAPKGKGQELIAAVKARVAEFERQGIRGSVAAGVGQTSEIADQQMYTDKAAMKAGQRTTAAATLQEYGKRQGKKQAKQAKTSAAAIQPTDASTAADAWAKVANASKEQRDAAEVYFRALARGFAKMNPGRSEGDFYSRFSFKQSTPGDVGKGAMRQGEKITDSPEFKRWFGESKVVDESGEPLVVYHGTSDDVLEFDLDHPNRKDTGWLGTGVYLTTNPSIASSYSRLKTGSAAPNVMPLYARLRNPYFATEREKQRFQLLARNQGKTAAREAADIWTRELKAKGHDGVILEYKAEDVGQASASKEIVVFAPSGVKSATGNRGTFDPNSPNILEQNDSPFYSQAVRTVENLKQEKMTPQQFKAMLEKGGVKSEEMKWTGLDDFIAEKARIGKSVTKTEAMEFVQANQIEVKEVVKDDNQLNFNENNRVKFETYQFEGGTNYRELLLTFPAGEQGFESSHFDEPNILAHIRFNERTDTDGKRVLFIEEIQSDWHQKGRKKGYATESTEYVVINKRSGNTSPVFKTEQEAGRYRDQLPENIRSHTDIHSRKVKSEGVPDAPFKKNWHELAFKRTLRWAAENGFDRVAWTTGEQQAERYDLSKQISKIVWLQRYEDDPFSLLVFDNDGNDISETINLPSEIPAENIEDYVGKEIASKILKDAESSSDGKLEGVDLKVGGEGMKAFYDKILPAAVNKIVGKFDKKAKVGSATIETEKGETQSVHSLEITPAIGEAALSGLPLFQQANGAIEFNDGKAIIHAFEAANFSTLIHETAHLARRYLDNESLGVIEKWAKVKNGAWDVSAEERFARAFERYMRSGKAPVAELQGVFDKIKVWMKEIYKTVKGSSIDVKFNKNVETVFARMLGADAEFVRTTPKKNAANLSLGQLIRQAGGLKYTKNDRGELKWLRESRMGRQPGFISGRGMTLDEAREMANQYGYKFETPNDFLNALMEEARGNKQFVPEFRDVENETADAFNEEWDAYNEYLAERDEADHNRLQEAYADPDFDAAMSRLILEGVNEERLEQLRTVAQAKLGWSEEAADRFIRHIQEEDAARLDEEGTNVEGYEASEPQGDVERVSTDDAARVSAVFDSLKQQANESGRPLATVIDDYLRQGSLFSQSELTPQQQRLLSDMAAKTRRGKDASEQGGLFGDTSPTVESTLEQKKEDDKKRQQAIDTLFQEGEGDATMPGVKRPDKPGVEQEEKGRTGKKAQPWEVIRPQVSRALRKRGLRGDALLDAEDLADELADSGAEIQTDGTVTLYHRTSQDRAKQVIESGQMLGDEDGIFFSTKSEGYASGYGDTILRTHLPLERLELDDVFEDEAHVRLPLRRAGQRVSVKAEILSESSRAAESLPKRDVLFQDSPLPSHIQSALSDLANYHATHTSRDFKEWSKAVVEDAGEWVRPYLKEAYDGIQRSGAQIETGDRPAPKPGTRSLPVTLEEAGLPPGSDLTYEVVGNEQAVKLAKENLATKGVDGAAEMVRGEAEPSAELTATGLAAIAEYQKNGEIDKANALASDLAAKLTSYGQAVQAVKVLAQFSPERALLTAQKLAKEARKTVTTERANQVVSSAVRVQELESQVKELESIIADFEAKKAAKEKSRKEKIQEGLDAAEKAALERLATLNITPRQVMSSPSQRGAIGGERADQQTINDFAAVLAARVAKGDKSLADIEADLSRQFGSLFDANLRAVKRAADGILKDANKPATTSPRTPTARAALAREVRSAQSAENRAKRQEASAATRWDAKIQRDAAASPTDMYAVGAKLLADGKSGKEWEAEMEAQFGDAFKKAKSAVFKSSFAKRDAARKAHREIGEIRRAREAGAVSDEQIEQTRLLLERTKKERMAAQRELAATFDRLRGGRVKRLAIDLLNLPKSAMASTDLSAPLRQGAMLLSEPKSVAPAMAKMFKSFVSTKSFEAAVKELEGHRDRAQAEKAGLFFATTGAGTEGFKLSAREDSFASRIASYLPNVKYSEQAYTAYLDTLRLNVFSKYADTIRDEVRKGAMTREEAQHSYEDLAKVINWMTGRGTLGKTGEQAAPLLNAFFFSPRYVASRFQILGALGSETVKAATPKGVRDKLEIQRMTPTARKLLFKKSFEYYGLVGATLGLAAMFGADVEWEDPESPDWLKIKVGNTRYDILAGFQQDLRLMYRLSKMAKEKAEGKKPKGQQSMLKVVGTFGRSKLSPSIGFGVDYAEEKNIVGEPFDAKTSALKTVTPLIIPEAYAGWKDAGGKTWSDALKLKPLAGAAKTAIPAFFGVGTSTYVPKNKATGKY